MAWFRFTLGRRPPSAAFSRKGIDYTLFKPGFPNGLLPYIIRDSGSAECLFPSHLEHTAFAPDT